MRQFLFFSLLVLNSICFSQLKLKLEKDSLIPYYYINGDEFSGYQLNETVWKNGLEGRRVIMTQDLSFSPNNVIIEKGLVRFLAKKEDSVYVMYDWEIDSSFLKRTKTNLVDNKFLTKFSAGSIMSKQKWHYGFYEIRFKVEEGKGIWPAFWFYGGNKNEEIDVFELKCEKNNSMHLDTHCPYGCDRGYRNKFGFKTNWGNWTPTAHFLHDGFNIMALDWKKDELFWYLNGYPVAYFKGDFPNPMNLYLNTSVAKDGDAFDPGPDSSTKWPNSYYVDYLRIWKRNALTQDISLSVNDEFTSSNQFDSDYSNYPTKKRGLLYVKKKLKKLNGSITLNVNSRHELCILALGAFKDQKTSLTIKTAHTNTVLTSFEKEIILKIDENDIEIQLQINIDKKTFVQSIRLL